MSPIGGKLRSAAYFVREKTIHSMCDADEFLAQLEQSAEPRQRALFRQFEETDGMRKHLAHLEEELARALTDEADRLDEGDQ